jgi:hypothetical protein
MKAGLNGSHSGRPLPNRGRFGKAARSIRGTPGNSMHFDRVS